MNPNDLPKPIEVRQLCEVNYGVSGLLNSSLLEKFFPDDLPEDWRLSYYSNEFNLLLISLFELNISNSSEKAIETMTSDEVINILSQYCDELEDDFYLLFDVARLSNNTQLALYDSQKRKGNCCFFINSENLRAEVPVCLAELECLFIPYMHKSKGQGEPGLLCIVSHESEIKPPEVKMLIEQIRIYAKSKEYKLVNILFSSTHYALENCRNAISLGSMM